MATCHRLVVRVYRTERFTFRASRALSSVRTVEPPPSAQGRPGRSGGAARRPGLRWGSPPGSAAASEQRRIASMAAPRCTTVAEVMLNERETLSCAEKRDGSGQYVIRAGSGELGEACAARFAVVHQHASGGRRRPACNMLPVMRGRADTCTARLAAVLDQASISGSSAEPGRRGRLMNALYPGRRERA